MYALPVKKLLLTGAGGFTGHHVLEHILLNTDWDVIATDSFRHKGRADRIAPVLNGGEWERVPRRSRGQVITHDLAAPFSRDETVRLSGADYVIAMASESHVDRSIRDPVPFVRNNADVMLNTLELCRAVFPEHVIVISTDEVYGPVPAGSPGHGEWSPILPSNPYSASKAAQEAVAISYWRTYGVPVTIVNCMNLFGERQDPEKFIPKTLRAVTRGETVTVHGTPGDVGTRHWLHARNLADALLHILRNLPPAQFPETDRPDRWNIASPDPVSNLEMANLIATAAGCELHYELTDFHSARPGHDPHYGLDPSKLEKAGWKPPVDFAESLDRTVKWTLAHPSWLD